MNTISALPSEITEWLSLREELNYIKFYTEFPPVKKAVPLKKTTVAVGLGSVTVADCFEGNGTEVFDEDEYCRSITVKLRFSIHVPYSAGGAACHRAFADIIDCLAFDSGLDIRESGCDSIEEDRDTDALVLTAHADVNASLCPAENTDIVFPSFFDKTLLCGSHISNTAVHLNAEQAEMLENPSVSGQYTGNGNSQRTVSLGFMPREITVAAKDYSPISPGTPNEVYYSFACIGGSTMGCEITANGFTVKNGSSYEFEGAVPMLNKSGVEYFYSAAK